MSIAPSRYYDRVGPIEKAQRMWNGHRDTTHRTDGLAFSRTDCKFVPGHLELRPIQRKELNSTPKLKRAEAVVSKRCYEMRFHGRILTHPDLAATAQDRPTRSKISRQFSAGVTDVHCSYRDSRR